MHSAAAQVLILLTLTSPAFAQETRVEAIAQQQSEKAAVAQPHTPSKAERIFLSVKKELIDTPSGLYPLFGSVLGGGGLAMGGGYRKYYGDRTFWDVKGMLSIRNYRFVEASTTSPGHSQGRLDLNAHLGWRDATQVAYYGLGTQTSPDDRTNFRLKQTYAGAGIKARPIRWLVFGSLFDVEKYQVEEGLGAQPSIATRYNAVTAPGLGINPTYFHAAATAGIDWRPAEGYARRGGLYELRLHSYSGRQDVSSFDRLEAGVVQHLPILRENWVLSGHGLLSTTLNDADTVPFFILPALGSASTLRGFSAWRFRDRHSLLLQGEFRWIPNRSFLDMAIFYDAGKVTSDRGELNLDGLKSDVGVEARFHGPVSTPLRLGIARSNEGWRIVFGGSAAF